MQRIWMVLACGAWSEEPRPEQVGQPVDLLGTACRMAAVRAVTIAQDQARSFGVVRR